MKILLVGDICPSKTTRTLFEEENIDALFADVLSIFKSKDFIFANLECAITDSQGAIKKHGPNLKAPIQTASVLKKLGITCLGLSNNHIFDFGIKGYEDTIKTLDEVGIEYTGFGKDLQDSRRNYYYELNGEKICIIAVCEHEYSYALEDRMGSRPFDEFETIEDIRSAKQNADRVIVIYHGGKEFCKYPSPRLVRACHAMARAGADVILGQHSHCIGTYEQYENCHILYGQGNFHFASISTREEWFTELAVEYDSKTGQIEFIPIRSTENSITLAKGDDKEQIMNDFEKRCEEQKNGEWKSGWHKFCVDNSDFYVGFLNKALEDDADEIEKGMISHFLDCEAHNDVLRELYPSFNLSNER